MNVNKVIKVLERQPGLGRGKLMTVEGFCAVGALLRCPRPTRGITPQQQEELQTNYGVGPVEVDLLGVANDTFLGSPEERKARVIQRIREGLYGWLGRTEENR